MECLQSFSSPSPTLQIKDDEQLSRQELTALLKKRPSFLHTGKSIHASIVNSGLLHDPHIGNLLICMYRDCRALEDARLVFNRMPELSVVSWTTMMSAFCDHGRCSDAMRLFHHMQEHGCEPNHVTLITILSACTDEWALIDGNIVHAIIVNCGLEHDIIVATSLIKMYGRCGDDHNARIIFDQVDHRDIYLCNTMIAAYVQCGHGKKALTLLRQMLQEGINVNQVTYVNALGACTSPEDLEDGKFIHDSISKLGLDVDVVVGTAFVNMYGRCGAPCLARAAYDNIQHHDVISWTTMIAVHSSHGQGDEAFELFEKYCCSFETNQVTFVSVLSACTDLARGKTVHAYIIESGFESDVIVGTALINMYGRCGLLEDAWLAFNKVQLCDTICWNSMIALYGNYGHVGQALSLLEKMQQGGLEPDSLTYNGLLCACASPAALSDGKRIHESIKLKGFESDIIVANALVSMYSKCGAWGAALAVFEKMGQHNLSSWNAIIAGCCQHGHAKDALQMFDIMQSEGVEPDNVTYLCLLNACSHAGLIDECYKIFLSMVESERLGPRLEHLTCIVGLLGRSGRLEDAENLIRKSSLQPDSAIWMTLLGACCAHGDVSRGERIADIIFTMDPDHEAAYILLANIYLAAGRCHDMEKVEQMVLARGFKVPKV
eukprot:c131_g1_i1 orf=105-2090(+)